MPAHQTAMKEPALAPSSASRSAVSASAPDAVKLLTTDHREVKQLFQLYQELVDAEAADEEKHPIAQQICMMLTVHAQVEEEIFYPAARAAIREPDLVDEATVEHASAKELIAQIEAADPMDPLFDAKIKVLGEYIDHHVKEEESEMFPQARKAKVDMKSLGEKMQRRKSELLAALGQVQEGDLADD